MRLSIAAAVCLALCASAEAGTPETYTGRVLPFEIITAIRNYGYKEGMRPAQVAISVKGGTQGDWLATAAYVAEKSIVSDVTFSTVEVYVATPWGDLPPTRAKQLAKAYYGGPDPTKSPWPESPFGITAENRAPTLADIEFYELSSKLLEENTSSDDPEKDADAADGQARKLIRHKYHLPPLWLPSDPISSPAFNSVTVNRRQIIISSDADAAASLAALQECLTMSDSAGLFRGCQDRSEGYSFKP